MASAAVAVSGYEILGVLDDSGSGRLYKARQKNLDRLVALKVLAAVDARDPAFVARFRAEAKAAASLRHPNIVSVFDQGTCPESGTHYVAYEYVEGPSAETLVTRLTALPEREALELCYGVALGLACAEEHRIVHRDVQPANIVLSQEGVPKLVELGLAKRTGDITTTAVGRMLKNAHYVSPEQALGLGELDTRADLYALGVCLYRFVTGRYPFEGNDGLTIVTKHVNEDLPDPREVNPSLSEGLVTVCMGLAARDPADRYETARAAAHDLARVLDGLPALGPTGAAMAVAGPSTPPRPSDSRIMQGLLSRSSVELARELARLGPEVEETPLVYRAELYTGDVLLQEHRFDKDVVVIGRGKDCEIHIDNPIVSRRHAELRRNGQKLALVALPTTNGTMVDGFRVEDMTPVDELSRILVADKFRLVVKFERPALRPEPEPEQPEEDETTTFKAAAVRDFVYDDAGPEPDPEPAPAPEPVADDPYGPYSPYGPYGAPDPEPKTGKLRPMATPRSEAAKPASGRFTPPPAESPTPSRGRPAVPAFGRDLGAPAGDGVRADEPSPYGAPGPYLAATRHEPETEAAPSRAVPRQGVLDATPPTGSQRRPALPTLRDSGRLRTPESDRGAIDTPPARLRSERATTPIRLPVGAGDPAALLVQRNGREQRVPVAEALQLGKAPECDLRLQGGFAPRKAALILRLSDGWWVFNVGPSPDTVLLNGAQVPDRSPLRPGDRLVVYGLEATFALG